jgi:hypothetical protein
LADRIFGVWQSMFAFIFTRIIESALDQPALEEGLLYMRLFASPRVSVGLSSCKKSRTVERTCLNCGPEEC